MKKLFRITLMFLVLATGFPIYAPTPQVDAAVPSGKPYRTGAWFEDGELVFRTWNLKATSAIRYRTAGFILRADTTCQGDEQTSQCTPKKGGDKEYLEISRADMKSVYETGKEPGECTYVQSKGISYPECDNAIIISEWRMPKDDMTALMVNDPIFKNYADGQTVYLNTVFTVYGPTSNAGKIYEQNRDGGGKKGIYDAEGWACKDKDKCSFRTYYDLSVPFKGSYPIYVQTLREDTRTGIGTPSTKEIVNVEPDPEYESGKWPAWKYDKSKTAGKTGIQLDPTIVSGGKTYFLKCSYITRLKNPVAKDCSSETDEEEWVRFASKTERNPNVYIGGTYVIALYTMEPDCNCVGTATIPSKEDIEGEVPADNTTIGQKVTMQVDLQQSPESISDWNKWVKNKTDFKIQIILWRSDNDELSGLSNTGASAIWSDKDSLKGDPGGASSITNSVTAAQLIAYLNGGNDSKQLFEDDLTNYPIPEGGKVGFRYNTSVTITAKKPDGTIVEEQCSIPAKSVWMTWNRPYKPKPSIGRFASTPKMFSEIKEGSPQSSGTSSNENFDAMSGTPTTRSLYFASGGSEFMVDVEVEYVPKVSQTRTYKSYFTSVPSGWSMSPSSSDSSTNAPLPPAHPQTKVDVCSASYTEKYSESSSTSPGPPSVTTHTRTYNGYSKTVGGYSDTWTQTVTFDYMRINKVAVWKIERSKVNGMTTLVGTGEVTASIAQGDPTYFMNIASSNTSSAGRLRYSLEPNQHDSVEWNEGPSDNCDTNSKDSGPVKEQDKFTERRNLTTNVTAVSDFLVLQTSSGDQSVMYFQKPSNTAKVTEQLDVPTTDFDTMWTNNPLSAAKWDPKETIKIGSYNGNYGTPSVKYSGSGGSTVTTVFDSMPAGLNRPSRPSAALRLQATGLDVPDTLSNGEYVTGYSDVFYKLMFDPYIRPEAQDKNIKYNTTVDAKYGTKGQSFPSPYSLLHQKVNDVVIHDPVSVQNAMIISLPDSLDQRTTPPAGNKQEGTAEYERVLDPNYRQNIIPNPDAEIINLNRSVAGWNTWVATGSASDMAFTSRTGDGWVISGAHTFEVNSAASSGTTGGYWKDIPVKPNTNYRFEADMSCHRCSGYFSLDLYSSSYGWQGGGFGSTDVNNSSGVQHKTVNFTTTANTAYVRIHMMKGTNLDAVSFARDYLFVDNMTLKNMTNQEFVAVEAVQVTQEVPNPDYVPASSGTNQTFNYTGGTQTFTATKDGEYTLEVWGAQGSMGNGGLGGYSKGTVYLTAGQTLTVQVGGTSGYNGGGISTGNGSGTITGGGASDVRTGAALSDRIIVAGGGGGGGDASGGAGNDSSANYSLGSGESYSHGCSNNVGPGGGGYYGGYSSTDGSSISSQGGSGYVGGVTGGTMQSGIQAGNGKVVITLPPQAAVGSPTKIITTSAGGSDMSPPSDAYILQPVTVNPNTPAGGYTPGNFILLDYGFQLYYPNTGDFYGNGQWGWSDTTQIRGKGFVNGMDTTEWTKAKYVKFKFNVIYNDTMYLANEWIQLPVTSPGWLYDFYVPLANREQISSMVEWKSVAINAPYEDGETPTNKVRYSDARMYAAKHSTFKRYQIDVVGRIGNMVIEDTGDFRFSNLFKQPLVPTEWFVPNVVKKVNPNAQNRIVGDTTNIRGDTVTVGTKYLNTYGLLSHMEQNPISFPLTPTKNNITALQNQPMRPGYEVLTDIQTIGNYYSNMQILPYYYHVNLQNGTITPVDIYMSVNGAYKIINKNGGGSSASVYSNPVRLDWDKQEGRRNVTVAERDQTSVIAELFAQSGGNSATGKAAQPYGVYLYGNSQFLQLTGRNRTYIGRDETYGWDKNPGNRLAMMEYAMQGQRWHFSYVLPSSAVAVRAGQPATQANISALRTNTGVIVMAADIKAVGDTYTLQYRGGGNSTLNIAGTSWPLTSIPFPVIAVYSAHKSSADDLKISGTH